MSDQPTANALRPSTADKFSRFSPLYKSAQRCGADSILRRYLALPNDWPIPISISHGVDAGHLIEPFDVNCIEPIHWCTNQRVYQRAVKYKPSLLIPHPWVIVYQMANRIETRFCTQDFDRLVVLPPPGPINDSSVLDWLKRHGKKDDLLLVKARGSYATSIQFFCSHGFATDCIASRDSDFYYALFRLLRRCKSVIGLTASSLLFFSAAIGIPTTVADDFVFNAYDVLGAHDMHDYSFPLLREFILSCLNNEHNKSRDIAAGVLGEKYYSQDPSQLRLSMINCYESIESPYFSSHTSPRLLPKKFYEALAVSTCKQGLLNSGLRSSIARFVRNTNGRNESILFSMNEIDCILNGRSEANYSSIRAHGGTPGHGH